MREKEPSCIQYKIVMHFSLAKIKREKTKCISCIVNEWPVLAVFISSDSTVTNISEMSVEQQPIYEALMNRCQPFETKQ